MKNLLLFIMALFVGTGCSIVNPGERGIRIIRGEAQVSALSQGMYLYLPVFYSVAKLDTQIQKSEVRTSASSRDMQEVATQFALNWSIIAEDVVNVYSNIGYEDDVLERVIAPATSEVVKAATAKLTAEAILTHRLELKQEIDQQLKLRLAKYGVTVHDISIVDLQFTEQFTHAVESKQIAEQRAKQAEYEAQKATQDAVAAVEYAKGQAASQKLLQSTLTPQILQQQAISKWNGAFPQVLGGNGALPFININTNK